MLYGAFLVGNDPMAGTGQYVYTPPGSAGFPTAPDNDHKITQTVTVAQAGTYLIRAHVQAVFDDQNSFWVKVDGLPGTGYLWDITESNPTYGLDYVSNRGTGDSRNPQQDPVEIALSAGTHTIEVFAREAGTRLDNIGLEPKTSADSKIISRNKPATASSSISTLAPGKAVDGIAGTRWESQAVNDQWIRIDLQARYRIHRVMLYWDAGYGKDYDIQLSEDGNTWTTYYPMRNGTGGADNLILDGLGRYIRMKGIARGTSAGYSLKEFDVYGTPAAAGSGGFVCEGACLNAEPAAKYQNKILNTTGERWYLVEDVVTGWQASETAGRQIFVNGVQLQPGQMPLPARVNGKYYFRFSPGQYSWTSWSFWN
jgi:predicted secreted protein